MPTITAKLTEGTAVEVSNGRHVWLADEPAADGGTDTGPTPYELLLSALASCACLTIAFYARRHKLELASVSARFDYERLHADDCRDCIDGDELRLARIRSHIVVTGDLTDAQRQRLIAVVSRCPVHKTLERGLVFEDHIEVQ